MNYKKYRIFLQTPTQSAVVAASNTVNDLVNLTKWWFENTTDGQYMPYEFDGFIILQQLDEVTGSYKGQEQLPVKGKEDVITQLRILGGR